jgi:hypothetical protein
MGYYNRLMTKKRWIDLFWEKVQHTNECWVWTASKDRDGYGYFGSTRPWSRSFAETREVKAHRISWFIHYGPIPSDLWVLHTCDNPSCVRPSHLWLGTNIENSVDRSTKKRNNGPSGEACRKSSLTQAGVANIRRLWATGRWSQQELAEMYEITQPSVSDIVNAKTWVKIL